MARPARTTNLAGDIQPPPAPTRFQADFKVRGKPINLLLSMHLNDPISRPEYILGNLFS
jgi:hypothetical protein